MTGFPGFRPAAFQFLRDLGRNNEKVWFEADRDVYEREVRGPMRQLVDALDAQLASIAPEIVGDVKRSMFRIHRDVPLSQNKAPFKANAGAWLYHRDAGRKVGTMGEGRGAGFYFHIDDTMCFMAGGMWMPARPALLRIREAIAAQPTALAHELSEARKLIATSLGITIMPPDDGEDMAPTKRLDDPDYDHGVSMRTSDGLREPILAAGSTMLDDALHSGSTTVDRQGGCYLGIPQKRPWRPVHRAPETHTTSSRDSPAAPTNRAQRSAFRYVLGQQIDDGYAGSWGGQR